MRWVPNLSVSLRVSLPLTIAVLLALPLAGWGQQELRSGQKGVTASAPVTSTSVDADTQALDVAIKAGSITLSGADGAIQDGVTPSIRATVKNYTNSKPLTVVTVDTNGDPVSAGGSGTQYTEDVPSVADPVGTQTICRRRDTLAVETSADGDNTAANCTGKGELYIKSVDAIPVTGTFWQATQPISGTVGLTPSASTGSAYPATVVGFGLEDSGGVTRNPRGFDLDTGAPTAYGLAMTWRKSGAGAPEFGTSTDPVRVDPTGTTTQPVSGTVSLSNNFLLDATFTGRLPAAFASADTVASQTATFVHGGLMGWNGTGWDRLQVDASKNLKVLVNAALPTGTNSIGTVQPGNTANTTPWLTRLGDGTNNVSVKAASTAAAAADPSLVVALSPNSPIPTGSNTIGALTANQSVNLNQVAGSAISTAATGVPKVGIVGNAGAAFDSANNAAAPANVLAAGFESATQGTTQPTASTAGNMRRAVISTDGALYTRKGGPVTWSCGLTALANTLTQCQAAPGAGLKLYITDIIVISDTATAGQFTLRYGTGTNCGTGTTTLFPNVSSITTGKLPYPANSAAQPFYMSFQTPIAVPTAANALCAIAVATNTATIEMHGYTAP